MPKAAYDVLFIDFYGTLVTGDRAAVEEACRHVVEDFNLDMAPSQLAVAWGKRFFDCIEKCNHDCFLTLFECECQTLCETVEAMLGLIDPVPYARMLKAYWSAPPLAAGSAEALAEVEMPICVVSNADTDDIRTAIQRHGLPVDEVVTSEDARSYKPDPVIFHRALERMKAGAQRVLHVGDSLHSDVGGAEKLGIATCWVHYDDRILDVGTGRPNHKIRHLSELREILDRRT